MKLSDHAPARSMGPLAPGWPLLFGALVCHLLRRSACSWVGATGCAQRQSRPKTAARLHRQTRAQKTTRAALAAFEDKKLGSFANGSYSARSSAKYGLQAATRRLGRGCAWPTPISTRKKFLGSHQRLQRNSVHDPPQTTRRFSYARYRVAKGRIRIGEPIGDATAARKSATWPPVNDRRSRRCAATSPTTQPPSIRRRCRYMLDVVLGLLAGGQRACYVRAATT